MSDFTDDIISGGIRITAEEAGTVAIWATYVPEEFWEADNDELLRLIEAVADYGPQPGDEPDSAEQDAP